MYLILSHIYIFLEERVDDFIPHGDHWSQWVQAVLTLSFCSDKTHRLWKDSAENSSNFFVRWELHSSFQSSNTSAICPPNKYFRAYSYFLLKLCALCMLFSFYISYIYCLEGEQVQTENSFDNFYALFYKHFTVLKGYNWTNRVTYRLPQGAQQALFRQCPAGIL